MADESVKLSHSAKMLPFEAGADLKAHVYQQLTDLEKYSVPATSMMVVMRKSVPTKKGNSVYAVNLVVNVGDTTLEAQGRARNVFAAVSRAKDEMEAQLNAVQNSLVNSKQRDLQIRVLMQGSGSNTIH
jgi:ribosomal subunit interface protein